MHQCLEQAINLGRNDCFETWPADINQKWLQTTQEFAGLLDLYLPGLGECSVLSPLIAKVGKS